MCVCVCVCVVCVCVCVCKQDLALNNLQGLICLKTQSANNELCFNSFLKGTYISYSKFFK